MAVDPISSDRISFHLCFETNDKVALMSIFELLVILAASPIIAILLYGAWKFSVDSES
jgi:hypothetical protein